MGDRPSRRQEAMRYWQTMQASAADLSFAERKAELEMLAQHCQSEVLRDLCGKSVDGLGRRPVRQRLMEITA